MQAEHEHADRDSRRSHKNHRGSAARRRSDASRDSPVRPSPPSVAAQRPDRDWRRSHKNHRGSAARRRSDASRDSPVRPSPPSVAARRPDRDWRRSHKNHRGSTARRRSDASRDSPVRPSPPSVAARAAAIATGVAPTRTTAPMRRAVGATRVAIRTVKKREHAIPAAPAAPQGSPAHPTWQASPLRYSPSGTASPIGWSGAADRRYRMRASTPASMAAPATIFWNSSCPMPPEHE